MGDNCWSYDCWNGWGPCVGAAPDFRGSYWGVVGKVFTRMAEYIKAPDMLQEPVEPWYPYPHRKPHPTLSVTLPNLTDADDVVRECFGAACAMIADSSCLSSSGGGEYVWLWLHYVPVGETDLDNAVGALGVVQVSSYTEGRYTAAVGEPTVWLVNDVAGDPRIWNDAEWLRYWSPSRKTFVGPGYLGWIDKRISGGAQNRITYHATGQATPSVLTWINTAQEISEGLYYTAVDVSEKHFPLCLGCWSEEVLFTDDTRQRVNRIWNIGKFNLSNGRLDKPDTTDDDLWELNQPPDAIAVDACHVNGSDYPGRLDEDAPLGPDSHFAIVVIDWVVSGAQVFFGDDEEDTIFNLWDTAIINGPDIFTADTDVGGLSPWRQALHAHADAITLQDVTGDVPSGTDDYPQYLAFEGDEGPEDDVYAPWGYMRLFEYYASHNQTGAVPKSPSFGAHYRKASESYDEIGFRPSGFEDSYTDPVTFVTTVFPRESADEAIPDPDVDDFTSNLAGEWTTIHVGFQADPNAGNFNCVRVPRKVGGRSDSPPRYYLVGNLGGSGFTWPHKDSASDGEERVPMPFYDSSGPEPEAVVIAPPRGFWKDAEGEIHRGNFAVQGQYDDHHPSATTIYDTGDTDYTDDGPVYP
jgi:hypothetical protein